MDINQTKIWFHEALRMNFKMDSELRAMLLEDRHPRVDKFLKDLDGEIRKAEAIFYRRHGRLPRRESMQGLAYDFANLFVRNIENEAKLRYESDLERSAREAIAQEKADMDATFEGRPSGIFEEAGVIVDETRQDEILPT